MSQGKDKRGRASYDLWRQRSVLIIMSQILLRTPIIQASSGILAEWDARCDLANSYRIVAKFGKADFGWTHCVYNHITYKLPAASCKALHHEGPLFLINMFGCRFDEVTPESLHTIDLEGNIVRPGTGVDGIKDRGVLVAGFTIHSAVRAARPDVKAIFHTHHPDVVAVSSLKAGLIPCSNEGALALATLSPNRHRIVTTTRAPRPTLPKRSG